MSRMNDAWCAIDRYAPERPHSTPLTTSARYRVAATEMPAVSTAPGLSPTARRRRPKRVRYTIQATAGTAEERGLAALVKPRVAEHRREARQRDVERHARHDLVSVMGDAREAVQEAHHDRRGDAGAEADPGRARHGR